MTRFLLPYVAELLADELHGEADGPMREFNIMLNSRRKWKRGSVEDEGRRDLSKTLKSLTSKGDDHMDEINKLEDKIASWK